MYDFARSWDRGFDVPISSRRGKLGDILELPTRRGFAYAHYVAQSKEMGGLIRVLAGFHSARPEDLIAVASGKEQFSVFFPVKAAIAQGIFQTIGNVAPEAIRWKFPVFRAAGLKNASGQVDWWLWDGSKSWKYGPITEEINWLPIKGIVNDTMLIKRIEEGWTPERDINKY
jgi:hypothetical protein